MFIFSNMLQALASILDGVLRLYTLILLISVLLSWVNPDPFNPLVRFLRSVSEPLFSWIRHRLPFVVVGALDLAPLVAILLIQFCQMVIVRSLLDLAARLR
ncbi:MAG: YggT family protein [Candidatus Omnitrophica bacterium]|nr:YggT family protein [Candidatus Omnitrophota bacterium]